MLLRIAPSALCALTVFLLQSTNLDVLAGKENIQRKNQLSAEPGQVRAVTAAGVAHRRPAATSMKRRRPRMGLVTKPGATVGRSSTHPTSIAASYQGGPPVFTTRVPRSSSVAPPTTISSTLSTTSATVTTSTSAGTSTSTATSTALVTTQSTTTACATPCTLTYGCPAPGTPTTCSGDCCAPPLTCQFYPFKSNYYCL